MSDPQNLPPMTDAEVAASTIPPEPEPTDAVPASSEPPADPALETKTYADGTSATGVGLPDVSPLDNTSPVVPTPAHPVHTVFDDIEALAIRYGGELMLEIRHLVAKGRALL